jgi:hypothetical protein
LLKFTLSSTGDSQTKTVLNNAGADTGMNIAYMLLPGNMSALVFLDDFGAGPDTDYDDIGFRIDIAAVPLPAGLPLLAGGLGLLGWLGMRKRRNTPALSLA